MAEHATMAFISGRWTKSRKDLRVVDKDEIIEIHQFKGPVATVERGYGLTISMGPKTFEFARVDVRIVVPCHVEDIDNADEFAKNWAEDRIKAEVASIRGGGNGKTNKPKF